MTALEHEIAECPDCKSMRGLGGQQCTGHQLLWQRVRIAELEAQLAAQSLDTKESGYQAGEHEPCPVCGHALLYLDDHYECDECAAKFDGVTTAITIHKDIKSQLAAVTAERNEQHAKLTHLMQAISKFLHADHCHKEFEEECLSNAFDTLNIAEFELRTVTDLDKKVDELIAERDAAIAERDRLAAENGMFKMGFHEAKQQEEKP